MGAGLPGPQPAVLPCRPRAAPLWACGSVGGVRRGRFALRAPYLGWGPLWAPRFPRTRAETGRPGGAAPAGRWGTRGTGAWRWEPRLSPPEQLGLQAPLRGILHQKDGGEGRGCCRRVLAFPGPCLSCLQIWSHIRYVRTTVFLGRRNIYMPKSGRQVRVFRGKKPRKCRRFLLRSLLTVYLLAFLHLQNIFILEKSCGLILLRILSLNVAKV